MSVTTKAEELRDAAKSQISGAIIALHAFSDPEIKAGEVFTKDYLLELMGYEIKLREMLWRM